ncbi:hypothetical protein [Streptomyces lavendulae]|uniref:hypothetical protein n=1 Tax=Streptomyces lavendulae TaxID=1914 RepID=UPI0033E5DA11
MSFWLLLLDERHVINGHHDGSVLAPTTLSLRVVHDRQATVPFVHQAGVFVRWIPASVIDLQLMVPRRDQH